ncbi:hypothetical protein TARUN_9045 [Trichoderma arundinaceum]|uniref:Uncharacterized protein n=1 Tax=Trichoderma arundinaceum TaxID=490622 RepID=A0A395NB97_TRIAR|nr:hypothetical protein TARUN_9045 [Trichoderma arundinaceum]
MLLLWAVRMPLMGGGATRHPIRSINTQRGDWTTGTHLPPKKESPSINCYRAQVQTTEGCKYIDSALQRWWGSPVSLSQGLELASPPQIACPSSTSYRRLKLVVTPYRHRHADPTQAGADESEVSRSQRSFARHSNGRRQPPLPARSRG